MNYIKSSEVNPMNAFFHFSRIDNRDSIEANGLQSVAGGENNAGKDRKNKTIYFSKGISGMLKAVDVWARWTYRRYGIMESRRGNEIKQDYQYRIIKGRDDSYDREIMSRVIFNKLYIDFKNRQYYVVDFIEGSDGDFEFGDIDVKKILARDKIGRPYPVALWQYGPYSDFGTPENPNNCQEDWNMNTKFGDRVITSDRLKIVETEYGKSDALSVMIEAYDKYRGRVSNENEAMFEILDNFIDYAKERRKKDKDFQETTDYGRRCIDLESQMALQRINGIALTGDKRDSFLDSLKVTPGDSFVSSTTNNSRIVRRKIIER